MRIWFWICSAAVLAAQTLAAQQALPRWPSLDGGGAYVLFLDHDVTLVNGSSRDFQRARALRTAAQEQLFWFQRGGGEYVLRDPAFLRQLQALFEPPMKLGAQQAALADEQTKVAAQLAAITAQQLEQGEMQTAFGNRMAQLAAEQVQLQEQSQSTEDVEAEIRGVEEDQERLEAPQAELANRRYEIEQQQQSLARQQEDLGRQQQKATQDAERQLATLVNQAIAKGVAKQVK